MLTRLHGQDLSVCSAIAGGVDLVNGFLTTTTTDTNTHGRSDTGVHISYSGVARQQNGGWGSKAYTTHHGARLGTSNSDREVVKARSNFVVDNLMTTDEQNFLRRSGTDSMLDMIRNAPCQSQFPEYPRFTHPSWTSVDDAIKNIDAPGGRHARRLEQFAKELTPSDVGKLNRLVIPKKHATECFPHVDSTSTTTDETVLEFVDRDSRRWRFRYCFWKSSQSYVFTRGWNNFVREKRLLAGDAVVFYRYKEITEGSWQTYWLIDTIQRRSNRGSAAQFDEQKCGIAEMEQEVEEEEVFLDGVASSPESCELMEEDKREKGFQLFGVWMTPGEEK